MVFEKKDFIEVEFTAKVKDGEIFDSNVKDDLKKADLESKAKPFVFSLGEGMFLEGVEDFLIGKDIGKYEIELTPEKAFGLRDTKLIKIVPSNIFKQRELVPFPGAMFNFDGRMAKILSVSGGRITVDFNNPVAGKTVIYNINVLRKVDDINEKTKAFIDFLFKKDFKFSIDGKKLNIEVEKNIAKIVEAFKDKFKEILGLELAVKEIEEKPNEMVENTGKKSQ